MALRKREYKDQETVISAENLNEIQDAVIALEDGLFSIDNYKSGEVMHIADAAKRGFRSLTIFGKTTQDGTPTPDAPVELVSVGDSGSITVNVTGENRSPSMTVATPNGLPGIPVASGGNYTDANGQQWICDEIDLAMGVYVQRISEIVMDETTFINVGEHTNGQRYCSTAIPGIIKLDAPGSKMLLSDRYETTGWTNLNNKMYSIGGAVIITDNRFIDIDTTNSILGSERPKVVYALATPIETPLSEEELAAYSALYTYRDNTTVSNDAGAYMELEYVMDAKKYIDSLVVSSTIHQATVE